MIFEKRYINSEQKNIGSVSMEKDNNNNLWFADGHPLSSTVHIYKFDEPYIEFKGSENFGKNVKLYKNHNNDLALIISSNNKIFMTTYNNDKNEWNAELQPICIYENNYIIKFEVNNNFLAIGTVCGIDIIYFDKDKFEAGGAFFNGIQYDYFTSTCDDTGYYIAIMAPNRKDIDIYFSKDKKTWNNVKKYVVNECNFIHLFTHNNRTFLTVCDKLNIKIYTQDDDKTWLRNYKYLYHNNFKVESACLGMTEGGNLLLLSSDSEKNVVLYEIIEEMYSVKPIKKISDGSKDFRLYDFIVSNNNITLLMEKYFIDKEIKNNKIKAVKMSESESVQKMSNIVDFIIRKILLDSNFSHNNIIYRLKNKISRNKLNNDNNVDLYQETTKSLFFGYTSDISPYSIPKKKDDFDAIPFIRTQDNDIFYIEDYDYINDRLITPICVIDNSICYLIMKNNNKACHLKWKSLQNNKTLDLIDTENFKLFNYSGNNITFFSKNRNITIDNNSTMTITTEKDLDFSIPVPVKKNKIIRYGQDANLYSQNITNNIQNNSVLKQIDMYKSEIQHIIIGYVNKNDLEMFPVSYNDIDNMNNWTIAFRFNCKNYFPRGEIFGKHKNTDNIRIHFNKSIGNSKLIDSKVIYYQDDNNKYELMSLNKESMNIDLENLNLSFYNRTNIDKLNCICYFTFLNDEYNFIIDRDELCYIVFENDENIKINSIIDNNFESEKDIESAIMANL
jgi:hypothetical protein